MKRTILMATAVLFIAACTPSNEAIQQAIQQTEGAQATEVVLSATDTPEPTPTATITNTPEPTNTPPPTATATQERKPIVLTGEMDDVVDFDKWEGPAIARINYVGSRNFVVRNYGANNDRYNLLVNTIGQYIGTVPIDFLDREHTVRFEIKASGSWEIIVLPLSEARTESVPGVFSGSGDDVIILIGSEPDLMIVDGSLAKSNFIIRAYGSRRQLAVNEIAPYTGTVILDSETLLLEIIEGGGEWTLTITAQ